MNSNEKSSVDEPMWAGGDAIESLAGAFHPHAIGIQEFSQYGLILDLRSRTEFEEDHLPGAVCVEPVWAAAGPLNTGGAGTALVAAEPSATWVPYQITAALAAISRDELVLLYCGQGGVISEPLAGLLRAQGWDVDVLPGGYVNYRNWVAAAMDVLPRMVRWRVVVCTLGSETARVLRGFAAAGQQVLDLEGLAGWRRFAFSAPTKPQPSQARFESEAVEAIRQLDPQRPVWVGAVEERLGEVPLGTALLGALEVGPRVAIQAPLAARVQAWREDEPLCSDLSALLRALRSRFGMTESAERAISEPQAGTDEDLLAALLAQQLDPLASSNLFVDYKRGVEASVLKVSSLSVSDVRSAAGPRIEDGLRPSRQ